jgi:aldehyde dehydrogenase (NAD+)
VAERIDAGMTHVNDSPVNDEPNTAFGGEKASGLGRWISIQRVPRKFPI